VASPLPGPEQATTENVELAPLLLVDQRVRWQRGDCVPVESYLEQEPSLHDHPHAVLDLILGEIELRREHGVGRRLHASTASSKTWIWRPLRSRINSWRGGRAADCIVLGNL